MTINQIARNLGISLASQGLKMLNRSYDTLKPTEVPFGYIKEAFNRVGLNYVLSTEMDLKYHTSDWVDLSDAFNSAYAIVKNFPWTADYMDCDNRSAFISVLCSIIGLTVGQAYGEVYDVPTGKLKYIHWFNVAIDKDRDIFVCDADNGGNCAKIEKNKDIVIGNCKYKIISVRFF